MYCMDIVYFKHNRLAWFNFVKSFLTFHNCAITNSPGNYRTQLYDKQSESYLPATPGLGMFVEVKDPDEKVSCHLMG